MDWRGWTGEMVNLIDLYKKGMDNIMTDKFKIRIS
jgi:hypothetical protein